MTVTITTPACIGSRIAAWLIDASIGIGVIAACMFLLAGTTDTREFLLQTSYVELGLIAMATLSTYIAFIAWTGGTPGMALCELMIVDSNATRVRWGSALLRPLGLVLTIASAGLFTLIPLFNERRRTIGDLLSKTHVIEKPAVGKKIAYDAWRVFLLIVKPVGVVSFAISIAAFLTYQNKTANKDILLDAVIVASVFSLLVSSLFAVSKVRLSRVRLTPHGIQRAGLLGWSRRIIAWDDLDHSRVIAGRHFPYFEMHKRNRRRFRVPMEHDAVTLTVQTLMANGIRIEQ